MNESEKKIVVVGTGDKAAGLAHMYLLHARKEGPIKLIFTEPTAKKIEEPFNEFVSIEAHPDALGCAHAVLLAIPRYALEMWLINNFSVLKDDCILVDVTNASKGQKDLRSCLKALNIDNKNKWVKAFNDTGAVQELQHHVTDKNVLTTNICGPDEESVQVVRAFAQELGYHTNIVPIDQYDEFKCKRLVFLRASPYDIGALAYDKHTACQQGIGWEWAHGTLSMVAIFLLTFTYIVVQTSGQPNFDWNSLILRQSNRMFAWTALYGFAFSLLPGTLIRLLRQSGCPYKTPRLLVWGCNIRKHVGLLSLYFLFLHATLVVLIFGSEYYGFMLTQGRSGRMDWADEASMLTAVLSTSLFIITGIASLPSVSRVMNKAQFMLVFGPVVWFALALGLMHIMFLGVPSWSEKKPYSWSRGMPPVTLLASLIPLMTLFLKALQVSVKWLQESIDWFSRRHTHRTSIHASGQYFEEENNA